MTDSANSFASEQASLATEAADLAPGDIVVVHNGTLTRIHSARITLVPTG